MISGIELVSIAASILIILSAIPKTQLYLRILNGFGSILLVVYGLLLLIETDFSTGYSTMILNAITFSLSIYHIVRIIKARKKDGNPREDKREN